MRDGSISISKVVTLALWTWTLCLVVTAWAAWLFMDDSGRLPVLLGLTACASSAVAATAQIRCYSLALCAVMKGQAAALRRTESSVRPLR